MEGTAFGRYQLLGLLGRGGMGEVWRAHDPATDRTVAIKVLSEHLTEDPTFQQRFLREAQSAAKLSSPHIIPIHFYGEIDGRLYVDMRLVDGRDLQTVLAGGPLDPSRAVAIVEQVARALQAAHKMGLVHRDVKPSNILLDDDDFAYLIDFGIARATDQTRMTNVGHAIGTFQYMAPERLADSRDDARADIYALACVLFECLIGRPPFPATNMAGMVAAHLHAPPPQPSTIRPDVPRQFDQVIATGMAKDPDQRYRTTVDLARAALDAITVPIRQPDPPQPRQTSPQPPDLLRGDHVKVIDGDRRFIGKPGRVVSVGAGQVDVKIKGYIGVVRFGWHQVARLDDAEGEQGQHAAPTESSTRPAEFRVGGWAQVVVGDKRFVGKVGQIKRIESGFVDLKLKRSVGTLSFRRDHLRPVEQRDA